MYVCMRVYVCIYVTHVFTYVCVYIRAQHIYSCPSTRLCNTQVCPGRTCWRWWTEWLNLFDMWFLHCMRMPELLRIVLVLVSETWSVGMIWFSYVIWLAIVHGGWSWFSACSVTCHGDSHNRIWNSTTSVNGDKDCVDAEWVLCNMQDCTGRTKLIFILCVSIHILLTHLTYGVTDDITRAVHWTSNGPVLVCVR